jgi:uncharacterized protein (UPF0276 family)
VPEIKIKNITKNDQIPTNKLGIGLRGVHIPYVLENAKKIAKKIGWLEVHSENYYAKGGGAISTLLEIRKDFPISLHCVGNALGSASGLDLDHLQKLKNLIEIVNPFLVSDHISWGMVDKKHLNDLLPLPYNKAAFLVLLENISRMQDFLKREILIENPSTYLAFKNPEMTEFDLINQLCKTTGCKLLLDVNNIFVSSKNNSEFDPKKYLQKLNKKIVKEIHLAGHSESEIFDGKKYKKILIDTHNDLTCKEVWELYSIAIKRFGQIPTLIEWDQDFPKFSVLLDEAKRAEKFLKS